MTEQSLLDLEFDSKMPQGYAKTNAVTGVRQDKTVWSHAFFKQVEEELTRPDALSVLALVWKFKNEYIILSRRCRNSFVDGGE